MKKELAAIELSVLSEKITKSGNELIFAVFQSHKHYDNQVREAILKYNKHMAKIEKLVEPILEEGE